MVHGAWCMMWPASPASTSLIMRLSTTRRVPCSSRAAPRLWRSRAKAKCPCLVPLPASSRPCGHPTAPEGLLEPPHRSRSPAALLMANFWAREERPRRLDRERERLDREREGLRRRTAACPKSLLCTALLGLALQVTLALAAEDEEGRGGGGGGAASFGSECRPYVGELP